MGDTAIVKGKAIRVAWGKVGGEGGLLAVLMVTVYQLRFWISIDGQSTSPRMTGLAAKREMRRVPQQKSLPDRVPPKGLVFDICGPPL